MWDPKQDQEEEDSWVVKAFAEDTCNAMGTTWPPRFYTCTFCRRKFQSAQALGGHMNVHRHDRAKLHQLQPPLSSISSPTSSSAHFLGSGDLCLLYQLPVPDHAHSSQTVNSGSSHLSYSPISASTQPLGASSYSTNCQCCSSNVETQENLVSAGRDNNSRVDNSEMGAAMEDIDLELRLGSTQTQSKK